MWLGLCAAIAALGCGRIGFDPQSGGGGSPPCTANCFPLSLYSGTNEPAQWGTAASALATGEVHLLYIDPDTGGAMWMYSDATLHRWSTPIDLADTAPEHAFEAVALIEHADRSLTALLLDVTASGTIMYRRRVAPTAPGVWAAAGPLATVELPAAMTPIYDFAAVADAAGTGGMIALASQGDDVTANAVYFTHSTDQFQTLNGAVTPFAWDTVAQSVVPTYFLEVRVASDSGGDPWVVFHSRNSTDDAAVLARPAGGTWGTGMPGWGNPWHESIVVDPANTLHVFLQEENAAMNPQHATATSLTSNSGAASIGNWPWSALPVGAYLRSAISQDGVAMRVVWEDPVTATFSARDYDGASWQTIVPDVVGTVHASATALGASLVTAPRLVAGTSHLVWRDAIDPGTGTLHYTLAYTPFTMCGGAMCALDEACVANACTPR